MNKHTELLEKIELMPYGEKAEILWIGPDEIDAGVITSTSALKSLATDYEGLVKAAGDLIAEVERAGELTAEIEEHLSVELTALRAALEGK